MPIYQEKMEVFVYDGCFEMGLFWFSLFMAEENSRRCTMIDQEIQALLFAENGLDI